MTTAGPLKYKRILLKCSGEALLGSLQFGIDPTVLDTLARDVSEVIQMGVEVGLVIGGGNLFRGKALSAVGLGRVTGDHMGMLATVMNALALRDALERIDLPARIMSAVPMMGMVDPFHRRKAITHLKNGHVVIFAAGIGNPFFTTDTAACLRAIEVGADVVLKATKVDGIYSSDPVLNPDAVKYDFLTYRDVLNKGLEVMDLTAICLCQDQNMPLQVFNMSMPSALKKVVMGEPVGTIVGDSDDR
ncbi:MAG: UMP kinase [Legionellaceae bacterium]|nr:UMP kinase [Legionellaceae bacterium]MBP9774846.1 UMP kinase [Legionellaceae bacterium]